MAIAFFDLDGTILSTNSAKLWIAHEFKANRIGFSDTLRASYHLLRYKLGRSDMDHVLREAIATLEGTNAAALQERINTFYCHEVRQYYRPRAPLALQEHQQCNNRLVLLTSALHFMAKAASEDLDLDDYLCTTLEVNAQGELTGNPVEPMAFGTGKLTLAASYAVKCNISLSQCYFYTDSVTDLPLLEAVGHPRIVQPDWKLRRIAKHRRWTTVDWDRAPT